MTALAFSWAGLRPVFLAPRWLALLALLPCVFLLARRSLSGLSGARRTLAIAIRSIIVLALVFAIAELEIAGRADELEVAFVLDRSLSIPPAARDEALRGISEMVDGSDPTRDRAVLVLFGRDAAIEGKVERGAALSSPAARIDPDGTNIGAALRLAVAGFNAGVGRRVVLISDGNQTEGDAARDAEALRDLGIVLDVLPVRYRYDREVLVERVVGPQAAHTGEPITLRVTIRSLTKTRGRVRLLEDGAVVGTEDVDLEPGLNVFAFNRTPTERGAHRFAATVESKDDTIAANNSAEHLVFIRGEGVTLYVPGELGVTAPLLDALHAGKVKVRTIEAGSLPADLGGYADADALILDDVPAEALTKAQMATIESAVHDLGLGLVMLGGEKSFGPGGWLGTPVETALPVDMDVKQKKVIPKGALAMILHTCEFADGNVWAVRIASAAVDALSSQDLVGLIDYGASARGYGEEWVFPLQQASNKGALKALIRNASPGDMPSFQTTVQMAHDALMKSDASLKHIVIITDGDPQLPTAGLLRSLNAKKITVSIVAINPHGGRNGPEVAEMDRFSRTTGGRFYFVDDPRQLPQIFQKEAVSVSRSLIFEEPFRARPGVPSEVLKGIPPSELPVLGGYVMTTPKARAQTALFTSHDDPLLATWQYGIGKSAAFTSSASTRWGKEWIAWPGYFPFYQQLVRAVAREVTESPFGVEGRIASGQGTIVLDAIDEGGRTVNYLDVEAKVATPKHEHRSVRLEQTAPGRYEASFDAREAGTFFANVLAHDRSGRLVAATGVALENPYSLEYRRLSTDDALLARLAEIGRGRVLKSDDPVFVHDVPADRTPREAWPFLLALAVSLVPIDVAARRLVVDARRIRALFLRSAPAPVPATGTLAKLKSVKESEGRKIEASVRDAVEEAAARGPDLGAKLQEEASSGPMASGRYGLPGAAPPSPPGTAEPAPAPDEKSGATLSRLREAKRRARGDSDEHGT